MGVTTRLSQLIAELHALGQESDAREVETLVRDRNRLDFFEQQARTSAPLTIRTWPRVEEESAILREAGVEIANDEGGVWQGETLRDAIDRLADDERLAAWKARPRGESGT